MGKRNQRVPLMESIERDIAVQLSNAEVKRVFEDGKPHTFTFFDALFLDGKAINTEALQPTVFHRTVESYDEFQSAFDDFMKALIKGQQEAVYENLLATRALARAAMVFAAEVVKPQTDEGPSKAMSEAFSIIGTGIGIAQKELFDYGMVIPGEVRALLTDYLARTPIPDDLPAGGEG